MDIDITCIEALEYVEDEIDGRLDPSLKSALDAHLSGCRPCRFERSMAIGARASVRRHMNRVDIPSGVRRRILDSIRPAPAAAPRPAAGLAGLLGFSGWRIPLAFGGALAIALITLFVLTDRPGHSHASPADGSVVHETLNHFDEVLEGRLQPDIRSDNPLVVQKYLEERLHFPVRMSPMRQFKLVGANLTTADNETTANLIYERDGQIVFMSQYDARRLLHGAHRYIPEPVLNALRSKGMYTSSGKLVDCTIAMWLADSTLCAAIADITEDQLLANITETSAR
jgi:anti-sigma factor RsiW